MVLGRYLARSLAGERGPERARYWLERALAQGQTEAAEDLTALSRGIAGNGSLTEGAMKPYQQALCACGSGLRSCRCCNLDPTWLASAEASEQIGLLVNKAAAALASDDAATAGKLCLNVLEA
jgi:hypothetical protein